MRAPLLALALVATGCQLQGSPAPADVPPDSSAVTMLGDDRVPSDDEVEAGRLRGRGLAGVDTTGRAAAAASNPETLDSLATDREPTRLRTPLGGDVEGPSVARLQTLLDRAGFSPGQIDGRWGDNTELAVAWFQRAEGLPATGIADDATARALARRAGDPAEILTTATLSADDVAGPFRDLPDDVYARAELDALGYETLAEKLGERFHAAPDLLRRLNPGVDLDALAAGDTLRVPNVDGAPPPRRDIARIEVSAADGFLHGLAADGAVAFHAPVTVGASYDPSPEGVLRITAIAHDPDWHYQPAILEDVPDDRPEATLPGGPNNAVGVVWMALSKEHYGIHGTAAPGTIGYAASAGCVRLTNWDARRLADRVAPGVEVRFLEGARSGPGRTETAAATRARAGGTG